MNFDPVFFDSPAYETASDAVVFCMKYFENGNADLVDTLASVCPITNEQVALFACDTLKRIQPRVQGVVAQNYLRIALNTLDRALSADIAPRSAA